MRLRPVTLPERVIIAGEPRSEPSCPIPAGKPVAGVRPCACADRRRSTLGRGRRRAIRASTAGSSSASRRPGSTAGPSCPARTPKRENVRFFATVAAAQAAGLRACKRCRPDASPGSPEWDHRADLVGRAMRLIADGVVDREGVAGLARRLGYTTRHVQRELTAVVGAGPLALARAQRAQTARILLETTELTIIEVAFAAGFQSVRQFNATVREVFAMTPRELRARAGDPRGRAAGDGAIALRLPYRAPLDADALLGFLVARAVPGVESGGDGRLPAQPAPAARRRNRGAASRRRPRRRPAGRLEDLRDLAAAVQRCRALLDLDADPGAVDAALGARRAARPARAGGPGPAGAGPRRRGGARGARRARPAGVASRAPARSRGASSPSMASRSRGRSTASRTRSRRPRRSSRPTRRPGR